MVFFEPCVGIDQFRVGRRFGSHPPSYMTRWEPLGVFGPLVWAVVGG